MVERKTTNQRIDIILRPKEGQLVQFTKLLIGFIKVTHLDIMIVGVLNLVKMVSGNGRTIFPYYGTNDKENTTTS